MPRWLLAALIVAGLVVLGGAVANVLWAIVPDTMVLDAMHGMMSAKTVSIKGDLTTQSKTGTLNKLSFSFASTMNNTSKLDITRQSPLTNNSFVFTNGTTYAKLSDIDATLDSIHDLYPNDTTAGLSTFGGLLGTANGKWVSIAQTDLQATPVNGSVACGQQAFNNLKNNTAQQTQFADAFIKNRFVTVGQTLPSELVNGRQSYHYRLHFDMAKANAFAETIAKNEFFTKLNDCYNGQLQALIRSDIPLPQVELWVDEQSHQLTQLKATSQHDDQTTTIEALTVFNEPQTITAPQADMTLSALIAGAQQSYVQSLIPAFGLKLFGQCFGQDVTASCLRALGGSIPIPPKSPQELQQAIGPLLPNQLNVEHVSGVIQSLQDIVTNAVSKLPLGR